MLVALLATAAVVYVGLDRRSPDPLPATGHQPAGSSTGSSAGPAADAASPSASPPAVDLTTVSLPRQPFCDKLPDDGVEQALGGPVASTYHYGDGDRRRITATLTDVAHEYNCTFTAADGTEARAWVFAAPMTRSTATGLVQAASRGQGCGPVARAPAFGNPTVATFCRARKPAAVATTLSGLFGDAWLSCRLSTPGRGGAVATTARAEQWCVQVAGTLADQG